MGYRVLVAESEPVLQSALKSTLEQNGIAADAVMAVSQVRSRMSECRYDLLSMDVGLVDGDGLEFAQALRNRNDRTPIIITSPEDSERNRRRAEEVSATAFLSKPFAMTQYRSIVLGVFNETANRPIGSAMAAEPPRILMYSHDSIGLGHMRRNANIAAKVLERAPGASVLMVVGCPVGMVFDVTDGIDVIKLPSVAKNGHNSWQAAQLTMSQERIRNLRAGLLRPAVEGFEPDVVLVDHMPTGVCNELTEVLAWMRRAPLRPHVVLGLRDILDAPSRTMQNWDRNGISDAISTYYDEILIYGEQATYDTAHAYRLEALLPGRVHYCSYVSARPKASDHGSIRAQYATEEQPFVLISGGGGRDAYPMMRACLDALELIKRSERPAALFVAGPLMPAELKADTETRAASLGCRYAERVADFPAHVAAADLLVSMGGYNSVVEAMSLGVPTLVIPRLGPSAEQLMRARLFFDLGYLEMLLPVEARPERLSARLRHVARRDPVHPPFLQATGCSVAAARIVRAAAARTAQRALQPRALSLGS